MAASEFVIAGRADCERYARLEAAADYFQSRLPSFRVHKEPRLAIEWPCYLRRTCAAQGWLLPVDQDGPLVWRLLVQRGGRGLLVGGLSEFLQLAAVHYGLTPPELSPTAARQMAAQTAEQLQLERKQRRQARLTLERRLTTVAVLGSPLSGAAAHFLTALAAGSVLGESVPLRLQLLGDPALPEMAALRWELHDLASPNLCQVALLPTVREAVRNASVIIVLDPIPNVLPPEPPPPPSPPPEEPPPPPPAIRAPPEDDTEREAASEPATAPAPASSAPPPPPQVGRTPSDDDRLPADLTPTTRGGRSGSARRSADSRKLSVIVEDPDSEEKEEEVMEQLMASRGGSSRQRSAKIAADSVTAGVANGESPPETASGTSTGSGAALGQTGSITSTGRPAAEDSSDRETDIAGWLDRPPEDDGDSGVTHEEIADLFCKMRAYAWAIDATATKRCRVVVAGGRMPCLAATVLLLHIPRLPRTNIIALCQPRVNQLRALLAARLGVAPHDVHGLAEWGNPPAGRAWLDLEAAAVSRHQGAVRGPAGYCRPLLEVLHQRQWLLEELPRLLAERASCPLRPAGAEVSALPLAVCLADTLRRWWSGVDDGRLDSLGVPSEGEFGVPAQLVLSAPVRLIAGEFRVCRAMPLSAEGAAAVRAAVEQVMGWLWRFGVRLSASGYHCTLSSCASSTITCCGSGERLLSDTEPTSGPEEKTADLQQGGAEGDGDRPAAPEPPADEDLDTASAPVSSAGSSRRASDKTESADSTRPGSAQGVRTPISSEDERKGSTTATPEERNSSASGEKTPASAGDRSLGSAGSSSSAAAPATEEGRSPTAAAGSPSTETPDEGAPSSEQRRQSGGPRKTSLTAEGERGYVPLQTDQ